MKLREQERNRTAEEVLECPSLLSMTSANVLTFADLTNVIFLRRHHAPQGDAPPCLVDVTARPAPLAARLSSKRFAAAIVATIALHGAALAAFLYEPAPLPSIGVEAISVEIVIGSNTNLGVQQAPSPSEFEQERVEAKDKPVEPESEPVDNVDAKIADKDMELAAVQPTPDKTKSEPEPQIVEAPKPEETKPVESSVQPIAEPKREKPAAKPVERAQPRQADKKSDHDQERTRRRVANVERREQVVSSNGAGAGRSSSDKSYQALVLGHLLRFKPSTTEPGLGVSTVAFSFNSSGAVTSARLASSSGNPRFDEIALSMVRRASPFPAPPDGRAQSFDVPIKLNR
jgi:protein TonB